MFKCNTTSPFYSRWGIFRTQTFRREPKPHLQDSRQFLPPLYPRVIPLLYPRFTIYCTFVAHPSSQGNTGYNEGITVVTRNYAEVVRVRVRARVRIRVIGQQGITRQGYNEGIPGYDPNSSPNPSILSRWSTKTHLHSGNRRRRHNSRSVY